MRRNEDRAKEKEPTYEERRRERPSRKRQRTKDKIKKQAYYTEKTKHNRARQIIFLSLPHSTRKIQADFLSKRPLFSRLLPLFYLKPPHPVQTPIQSYAQDTRLRVCTRLRTQRICHFCLHPSPLRATNCRSVA